jgi:hypothetical protein
MKARTKRCLELLDRVTEFFSEHSILTFGTRGTALIAEIDTTRNAMRSQGASQVSGHGEFRGGVADRRELAAELRAQMREIELTAEAMDLLSAPVPAEQLQVPRSQAFQTLLDTATAFVTVLTPLPVQQAFIDRDFPTDFVTELATLATQFADATSRKYAGQQTQMGGTLGVDHSAAKGLAMVKELNAIMIKKLRKTDPVLLGVWQAASRLEQPPRRTSATATTTPAAAPTTALRAEPEPQLKLPIGLERTAPSAPWLPNKPDIDAKNRRANQNQPFAAFLDERRANSGTAARRMARLPGSGTTEATTTSCAPRGSIEVWNESPPPSGAEVTT